MKEFFDRIEERALFDNLLSKDKSVFVVVYGRRRIGKSSLLRHIIANKGIYCIAEQSEKHLQMEVLADLIAKHIPGFNEVKFSSWQALFTTLENSLKERITIVLDEFPYLVHSSSELPSVIQKIIDLGKNSKFNLVLCGSSQQMMRELTLGITSPLYGRADAIYNIKPMKVAWLKEYLKCTAVEAIKEYATWGGVPRYWEIRDSFKSYEEAIKYAIFDKNGILIEEPMRLFLDDMRSVVQTYSVVSLVGNGNHRVSEIANKLEKPATHFSRQMSTLIEMGYLKKEVPFGESEKDSKRGLYWIADHFLNFYMQLVAGHKSLIELGLWDVIKKQLDVKLPHIYGKVWEELARDAVPFLNIDNIYWNKAYRYWGKPDKHTEIEIDVISESIEKDAILFGEVKWNSSANLSEVASELDKKIALLGISNKYKKVIKVLFIPDRSNGKLIQSHYIVDANDVVSVLK